jgi:glyoxylase-like metal-dependent hydrolase (beta-lactamase superfamily II)
MSQLIDARIEGKSRVFFVKGGRTAIIDTGAPGNERKILKALRVAGISQQEVSLIIITHAHWDHCGSAYALKAALNVPVMAGWPDVEFLEKGENIYVTNLPGRSTTGSPGPKFEKVKVDVAVKEAMRLDSYGIDAQVVLTPGHTEGSLSVIASDGNCATGDFLAGLYSGEPEVIKRSLRDLADRGAKRLHPAHGEIVETANVLKMFFTDVT